MSRSRDAHLIVRVELSVNHISDTNEQGIRYACRQRKYVWNLCCVWLKFALRKNKTSGGARNNIRLHAQVIYLKPLTIFAAQTGAVDNNVVVFE